MIKVEMMPKPGVGLLPPPPSGLPVRTLEWGLGRGQKQDHLPPVQNPNSEAEQRLMAERTPGTKIFENQS